MKILFLNLPSDVLIVRRYMCSSFAEAFLFPPHDLISLAGVARSIPGMEVSFLDAVGECSNTDDTIAYIRENSPDVLVSIISFELYDKDVLIVRRLKEEFPEISIFLFGHYPTHFPKETLDYSNADLIMLGEPDLIFSRVIQQMSAKEPLNEIGGIAYRTADGQIAVGKQERRVTAFDSLPMPAYDLLNNSFYREPFMPQPFGLIQSARGCPYQCNYCVHSFGTKLTMLSPETVFEHILQLKSQHNIRSLRFIDDTFTVIPARVIEICKKMIAHKLDLKWTCLARADTLNEEMLVWMKRAGCVRLNIGMESGSQKILDILNKGTTVESSLRQLQSVKKTGLEMMGFFLTGIPGETEDDINESIRFAQDAGFNYVAIDTLKIYPGTPLFEKFRKHIDFSLVPYRNQFRDEDFNRQTAANRKKFFRNFYFSMSYLFNAPAKNLIKFEHAGIMLNYVWRMAKAAS